MVNVLWLLLLFVELLHPFPSNWLIRIRLGRSFVGLKVAKYIKDTHFKN